MNHVPLSCPLCRYAEEQKRLASPLPIFVSSSSPLATIAVVVDSHRCPAPLLGEDAVSHRDLVSCHHITHSIQRVKSLCCVQCFKVVRTSCRDFQNVWKKAPSWTKRKLEDNNDDDDDDDGDDDESLRHQPEEGTKDARMNI